MSQREAELAQAIEQLARLYSAVAALRAGVEPQSPKQFALLAEGPLDQIHRLQKEIDELSGVREVVELSSDLWLRVEGSSLQWPDAPASIVTALVDALRKGVQAVAELLATGELTTRPTADLKRACDLRVAAFQSGSLRIGLRLPELESEGAVGPSPLAQEALGTYLNVADWVSSESGAEDLEQRFPDRQQRRALLNALKPLVPRPRGDVSLVELATTRFDAPAGIRLTKAASARIDEAIDQIVAERTETREGDLREIDLDKRSFILRVPDEIQETPCTFEDDLTAAAKEALDRRVRVTGTRQVLTGRRGSGPLRVTRLEIIEDSGGADDS